MKYFGTDGIRGIANQDLSVDLAYRAGRAGGYALTKHVNTNQPKVLVARDTRISGEMLENALVAGLLSIGIQVVRLGIVTTPGVAYLVRDQGADAGVMITASHNPVDFNGIKFFGGDGFKLSDEIEEDIEQILENPVDDLPKPSSVGLGTADDYTEASQKYLYFISQTIPDDLSGISVTVDAANGATSNLISRLYADVNTDFETIATKPDGININDQVGSTHPEELQAAVKENQSDLGIAFDGDGDRCIAVDELGNIVDGDKIMYICGKYMFENGKLKKDTIVSTVMSNLGMYKAIEKQDMKSVKTKVGDRYVVEEMRENGFNLGGEQSGHIVFLDFNTTGDGMLTSLQLMNVMKQTGKKLSELADEVHQYPQSLVNVKIQDNCDYGNNKVIQNKIKSVETSMNNNGRVLVRESGTEPLLRVMVEAPTQDECENYANEIAKTVKEEIGL